MSDEPIEQYQADLRREGAADAVLRIVAAKTLLRPMIPAEELCRVVGIAPADVRAALDRRSGGRRSRPTPEPEPERAPPRRWERFDRRWTRVDNDVYDAVGAMGTAAPGQVEAWLSLDGRGHPYLTVMDSLVKQTNLGRLVRPKHGRYRRAA